jgi:hypothetical protein
MRNIVREPATQSCCYFLAQRSDIDLRHYLRLTGLQVSSIVTDMVVEEESTSSLFKLSQVVRTQHGEIRLDKLESSLDLSLVENLDILVPETCIGRCKGFEL